MSSPNSAATGTSRSPAVRRLMKEYMDLQNDPTTEFTAAPLSDNIFEWHFTIRGPVEGGFQGGRYHGRIVFTNDYPFKPPNIYFLTPNGRFEINKKICLSITGFHPEFWRPAWGVRSALTALISFMVTPGDGAIGALDYTSQERAVLAKSSRSFKCSVCLSDNATCLPDENEKPVEKLVGDPELSFTTKDLASNGSTDAQTTIDPSSKTEDSSSISENGMSQPMDIPRSDLNNQAAASHRQELNIITDTDSSGGENINPSPIRLSAITPFPLSALSNGSFQDKTLFVSKNQAQAIPVQSSSKVEKTTQPSETKEEKVDDDKNISLEISNETTSPNQNDTLSNGSTTTLKHRRTPAIKTISVPKSQDSKTTSARQQQSDWSTPLLRFILIILFILILRRFLLILQSLI